MKQKLLLILGIVLLFPVGMVGCEGKDTDAGELDDSQTSLTDKNGNTQQAAVSSVEMTDIYLHFRPNGGEGGAKFYFIEDMDVSCDNINSFVHKAGYTLKCWNTEVDGTGTNVNSEDIVAFLDNETLQSGDILYAVWEENTQDNIGNIGKISYCAVPFVSGGCVQYVTNDDFESYTILTPMVRHGEKVFLYWNTREDGTGESYFPGDKIDFSNKSEYALYAIWGDKDTHEPDLSAGSVLWDSWICFHANGGEGSVTEHFYGNSHKYYAVESYDTEITRDGYTLKCWNTEPDGSGQSFYPGDAIFSLSEMGMDVYAIWEYEYYDAIRLEFYAE